MCREGAWTELTTMVTVGEFTKQTAWIFFIKLTKKGRIFCRKMIEWFRFVLKTKKCVTNQGVGYMETMMNGSGKHELHQCN